MRSFDEIKSILENELITAIEANQREATHGHHSREAVTRAIERYKRFVEHGMIPEDLADDDSPEPLG